MDFKSYMAKVEKQIKQMSEEQKTEWIYEKARTVKEENRQSFLNSLSGKRTVSHGLSAEDIDAWCEQVEAEELYFVAEYLEYGWGYDEAIEYHDTCNIIPYLQKAIGVCTQLVAAKEYDPAYQLLDRIYRLEFAVKVDDEYEDEYEEEAINLQILQENALLPIDLKEFMLNLLYACCQETEGLERLAELYDYLLEGFDNKILLTDLFAFGPEEIKEKEKLMQEWRDYLLPVSSDRAVGLLVDACIFIGGEEELLKTARENVKLHPALYLEYCKRKVQEGDEKACMETAKEAIRRIDENKMVRADIADIAAKAAEVTGMDSELEHFYYTAFHSKPNAWHLLRLYQLKDSEVLKKAWKRVNYFKSVASNRIMESKEQERSNIYDKRNIDIFQFLLGDYKRVLEQYRRNQEEMEWSYSKKRTIVFLLLLYLKKEEAVKTRAEYKILGELKEKLEMDHMEEEEYRNLIAIWKQNYQMPKEQEDGCIEWLLKVVEDCTKEIVGGGQRKIYKEAAQLIVVMGAIQEERGTRNGMRLLIDHYKMQHARKSAFKNEIEILAEKL